MKPRLDRQMMFLVGGTITGGVLGLFIQDKLIRKYEAERDEKIKALIRKDKEAAAAAAAAAGHSVEK